MDGVASLSRRKHGFDSRRARQGNQGLSQFNGRPSRVYGINTACMAAPGISYGTWGRQFARRSDEGIGAPPRGRASGRGEVDLRSTIPFAAAKKTRV
jgi:hypothetical protein